MVMFRSDVNVDQRAAMGNHPFFMAKSIINGKLIVGLLVIIGRIYSGILTSIVGLWLYHGDMHHRQRGRPNFPNLYRFGMLTINYWVYNLWGYGWLATGNRPFLYMVGSKSGI